MYWSMRCQIREIHMYFYIGSSRLCAYHMEQFGKKYLHPFKLEDTTSSEIFFTKVCGWQLVQMIIVFFIEENKKKYKIFITKIMKIVQVANKRKYIPSLQKMFEFEQNKKKTSISSTSETMQIQTWWCCQFGREIKSKIVIPKKVQFYKSMSW